MRSATSVKHVLRRLLRSPMFSVITLITLAIGIGANTAIFSVVNSILIKPLPYADPERLAGMWHTATGIGFSTLNSSPATYFTYREESRTFEDVGLWSGGTGAITGTGEPERVDCLFVTDGILPLLGVQPVRGRRFTLQDDSPGRPETAMLSYGYWQRRFGGDPNVIGRRLVLDGRAREIIGVLPRDFRFINRNPMLLLPLQLDRGKTFIGNFSYQGVGRLKRGVTIAAANADVARMIAMLPSKFPPPPGMSLNMIESARLGPKVRPLLEDVVGDAGKVLWVLMGTVGIVLFIACANVANLLLVRTEGRQQELAIRAALGAGWARIARELLLETVLLGLAGGVAGTGLAYASLRLLVASAPAGLPRLDEIAVDWQVLLFALVISLVAGVLFGLIPVFKYAGAPLGSALRQGGRTLSDGRERHRARSVLVVVQVALALVLLISSGLMIRTVRALQLIQPGFTRPEEILTLRISIPRAQVPDPGQVVRMQRAMVDKLAAIPGVASVGLSSGITMDGESSNDPIFAEDRRYADGELPVVRRFKFISPGYFQTMGNPLIAGRDMTWTEIHETRPVVILSENLARELWRDPASALGKRIRESPKGIWREIIGVAGDAYDDGVDKQPPKMVYWPLILSQFWGDPTSVRRNIAFAIRSQRTGSPAFLNDVRRAVWAVNPEVPIAGVRTVREIRDRSMARASFTLVMLSIAAAMALLLAVVGIYGVISYSVSQRTREIGIRIALGAPQGAVRQMFVRHGLLLTGIGVACGLVGAAAATRLMSALLFAVKPIDPLTYAAVAAAVLGAALLAAYFPARRATTIEPVEALRAE